MDWIHVNILFKDIERTLQELHSDAGKEKPVDAYKELMLYLMDIVNSLSSNLERYFFLFEPDPHLFFALELKDSSIVEKMKEIVALIKCPGFIEKVSVQEDTKDEANGETALDFYHVGTKHAFRRVSDDYKGGYYNNNEVKLVHCLSNQLFVTQKNEIEFYLNCLKHRGVDIRYTA